MAKFTDKLGSEWIIDITNDAIKRVRDAINVDLLGALGGEVLQRLSNDPILLGDLLFVLCRDEAEKRKISDVEFGRRLAGDVIDSATTAFVESLIEYFPAKKRQVLVAAWKKMMAIEDLLVTRIMDQINSGEIEKRLEQTLAKSDN